MDLQDAMEAFMEDEERLQVCRLFYRVGIFLLPIIWLFNVVWHYNDAFVRAPFPQQRHIKFYVWVCLVGSVSWILFFSAWAAVDHIRRSVFETIQEVLSFIRPLSHA